MTDKWAMKLEDLEAGSFFMVKGCATIFLKTGEYQGSGMRNYKALAMNVETIKHHCDPNEKMMPWIWLNRHKIVNKITNETLDLQVFSIRSPDFSRQ